MVALSTLKPWSPSVWGEPARIRPAGSTPQAGAQTINWLLIAIAATYLFWSAVHLPSSIWARAVLFSVLVIRMKPDVILPLLMVTPQMRWLMLTQSERGDSFTVLEDVYAQLTGVEQYAFTVPIVLIPLRIALAWSATRPRGFPSGLFILWLSAGALVAINTVLQFGGTGSWALAMRTYSVIGMYFYGMLLPRVDDRELKRLLVGVMALSIPLYAIGLAKGSATQLLYVVSPVAVGVAIQSLVQKRVALLIRALGGATIVVGAYLASVNHSMMHTVVYIYTAAAVTALVGVPITKGVRHSLATFLSVGTCATVLVLLALAVYQFHIDAQLRRTASTEGTQDYVGYKLFEERATIWYGQVVHLLTKANPIMPVFGQPFEVQFPGRIVMWTSSPHNLVLALLRLFGVVAGTIVFAVLGHVLLWNTRALWLKPHSPWVVIGVASLASILVGGLTLEYVITEWQSEWFLALAGLTSMAAIRSQRGC